MCKHYKCTTDEFMTIFRDKVAQRKQVLFYDELTKIKINYSKQLINKKLKKNYKISGFC